MTGARTGCALIGALAAAALLPPLFMAAEALVQRDTIGTDDLTFAYTIGAPFALLTALGVAWPAVALLPRSWRPTSRLAMAALLCAAVPTALIWPLSGEFPWKAALCGAATLILWACARHFAAAALLPSNRIRSSPHG